MVSCHAPILKKRSGNCKVETPGNKFHTESEAFITVESEAWNTIFYVFNIPTANESVHCC